MTPEQVAQAIRTAAADAATQATLAAHMGQCERDKAEMKAEQIRMHTENSIRFTELEAQNTKIMRYVWIATGALAALQFLSGRGADLVGRLTHG